MPTLSHQRWISPSPTMSETVPVQVLSLTMIIMTSASRKVIQNPGVRCWKVPESLSMYFLSITTFWSRASLPACTAARAAIMMEIFRVLAEGTGTPPKRSARWPLTMSFTYQLDGNGCASHSALRRTTRSRMGRWVSLFLVQPDVPEMHERPRLVPQHVLAAGVQPEVVADLDAGGVGVERDLELLDDGLALLDVALPGQGLHERILVGIAPPARPVAQDLGRHRGLRLEREGGRERIPQLRLVAPRHHRGPVRDLQIHLEAGVLELALGDHRRLVVMLVLRGHDPADRLAGVARFLEEAPGLVLVVLVVRRRRDLRMPDLLLEEDARIETIEVLVAEAGQHHRLHVERGLHGLRDALVGHEPLFGVEDDRHPAVGLDDHRLHAGGRLDALVLIGLHLLDVVVFAGDDAGLPGGVVGHRHEGDLVHVGDALSTQAAGRFGPGGVTVVAGELDVTVGFVLDELEGPGADELLELALAGRVDQLLGIDHGPVVHRAQRGQQAARRLPQPDLHGVRPLGLNRLDVLEERLAGGGQRAPPLERGHHVGGGQGLSVVELDVLAQADRVALAAVAHVVTLGQQGDRLILRVQRVQPLVDVGGDLARDRGRGGVSVQRGRLADHPHAQDAALARGLGGDGGDGDERDGEQHGERREQPRARHAGVSSPVGNGPENTPGSAPAKHRATVLDSQPICNLQYASPTPRSRSSTPASRSTASTAPPSSGWPPASAGARARRGSATAATCSGVISRTTASCAGTRRRAPSACSASRRTTATATRATARAASSPASTARAA